MGDVATFVDLLLGAMALDDSAWERLRDDAVSDAFAYAILLVAGASLLLGQSVALIINRTPRYRFVLSLIVSGLVFAFGILVWATTIAVAAWLLGLDGPEAGVELFPYVALGEAPLFWAFLALAPYVGPRLLNALEIWAFFATTVGVSVALDIDPADAVLTTLIGWLISRAVRATIGRPLRGADTWLIDVTAGLKDVRTPEDAYAFFRDRARQEGERR